MFHILYAFAHGGRTPGRGGGLAQQRRGAGEVAHRVRLLQGAHGVRQRAPDLAATSPAAARTHMVESYSQNWHRRTGHLAPCPAAQASLAHLPLRPRTGVNGPSAPASADLRQPLQTAADRRRPPPIAADLRRPAATSGSSGELRRGRRRSATVRWLWPVDVGPSRPKSAPVVGGRRSRRPAEAASRPKSAEVG